MRSESSQLENGTQMIIWPTRAWAWWVLKSHPRYSFNSGSDIKDPVFGTRLSSQCRILGHRKRSSISEQVNPIQVCHGAELGISTQWLASSKTVIIIVVVSRRSTLIQTKEPRCFGDQTMCGIRVVCSVLYQWWWAAPEQTIYLANIVSICFKTCKKSTFLRFLLVSARWDLDG